MHLGYSTAASYMTVSLLEFACILQNVIMIDCTYVQGKLYSIVEICRIFDGIYKEHLDGVYES